jgi:hypothetical protein
MVLALWVVASLLAFTLVTVELVTTTRTLSAILSHSATTTAHWQWKNCARKPSQEYTFSVDGLTYHGYKRGSHLDCRDIKIGDPIDIFYDTTDPSNQFVGNKQDIPATIERQRVGYLFAAVWSVAIFAFLVFPRWRALRKPLA